MLSILATIFAILIISFALIQLAFAVYFRGLMKRRAKESSNFPEPEGMASIVMSVRGCDPTLEHSIRGLLEQDYLDYEIHLVVDHRDDSAWKVAEEVKQQHDFSNRLTIHEMRTPRETCGLKCNALVQALGNVDSDSKYLVLIDADVRPHKAWLRNLLSPLGDKNVGVVTGNQWFEPSSSNAGSLIRSLWNTGAIVPTAIYSNPWAGSFSMRMEDVRAAKLAEVWQRSVVDDGPIRQAIAPLGRQIVFQPSLIMINRERCTFNYVNRYVTRMLTWSKLYETTFVNTVIHSLFSNSSLIGIAVCALLGIFWLNTTAVAIGVAALVFNSVVSAIAYLIVRSAVQFGCSLRNETLPNVSIGRIIALALLVPVTQIIYGLSCVRAVVSRQVKWREITYEVRSKSQVRMLHYTPMLAEPEQARSKVSI